MALEAWADFAVATVGAGAVLAGFVFVALSINLDRILGAPDLPARAAETLVVFAGVLLPGAVMLVPEQSSGAVGTELAVVGLAEAALLGWLLPRGNRPTQPWSWSATRAVTAGLATMPVALAGLLVVLGEPDALYLVAVAVVFAIVAGIGNTWVLCVEIVRDERYRVE